MTPVASNFSPLTSSALEKFRKVLLVGVLQTITIEPAKRGKAASSYRRQSLGYLVAAFVVLQNSFSLSIDYVTVFEELIDDLVEIGYLFHQKRTITVDSFDLVVG